MSAGIGPHHEHVFKKTDDLIGVHVFLYFFPLMELHQIYSGCTTALLICNCLLLKHEQLDTLKARNTRHKVALHLSLLTINIIICFTVSIIIFFMDIWSFKNYLRFAQ